MKYNDPNFEHYVKKNIKKCGLMELLLNAESFYLRDDILKKYIKEQKISDDLELENKKNKYSKIIKNKQKKIKHFTTHRSMFRI